MLASWQAAIPALIALHDIGKFSVPFQAKSESHWPTVLGPYPGRQAGPRHDSVGFALLSDAMTEVLDPLLPGWSRADRNQILRGLCGHHGRPPEEDVRRLDEIVPDLCQGAARAFCDAVIAALAPPPIPPLAVMDVAAFAWWLAGLTVLADWIGSAQQWFGYHPATLSPVEYWHQVALPRAESAVAAAGILPVPIRPGVTLADMIGAPATPSPVQALATWLDLGAEGPVLALIEDQTGSGKTEAALLLAHRLMQAGRAEGLFVALPTMATANGMYTRLAQAYRRLFDDAQDPSLVLAHGGRAYHPGYQDSILRGAAEPEGPDDEDSADETASAQCAAWIAEDRRRAFLAQVGVGTIDQALLAVLPSLHAPLRLLGLHRRVLLIDEAHAYDAYMREELLRLVQFQAGLGGSTVVLSATLPHATRRKLVAAWCQGAGRSLPPPCRDDYPLVTLARRDGFEEQACAGRDGLARRVLVERLETLDDAVERVVVAARAGQAVAWIRNAVDDVIEAAALLEGQGVGATVFHARFAMGDRQRIEEDVVGRFGKHGSRRVGVVCASSVIEQSLDLDFDLMVTDLAPIDLLIQRAGRLWRHARPGRPGDQPRLLVLSPAPVAEPSPDWLGPALRRTGAIYADHALLWRTAQVLFTAGVIEAPGDVRRLVEDVYADENPAPPGLQRSEVKAQGKTSADVSLAHLNLLDWTQGYRRSSGAWDRDTRTPTRLGEETVTLRLGRWDGQHLSPMSAASDQARAWALSEVRVRPDQASRVPEAAGPLAEAEAVVKAGWGKWERVLPIVAMVPDGAGWIGRVMGRGSQERSVRYDAAMGLQFA